VRIRASVSTAYGLLLERRVRGKRALRAVGLAFMVVVARPAFAGDVELEGATGATAYRSTWRGDYGAGSTLRAGARFSHVVSADFQLWESYATVNHRIDTGLSLGVTAFLPLRWIHPYLRAFVMHQHEEGLVSVVNAPGGYLFGIGAGIRHRAGGGGVLGVEVPLVRSEDRRTTLVFFGEGAALYFPDATLGPHAYFGIDLGLGIDFELR
jgi:hypothetical protein